MPPRDSQYNHLYGQVYAAYCQGDYHKSLALAERMIPDYPDDSHLLLLLGHIYLQLQRLDEAQKSYQSVLGLTEDQELVSHARQGLNNLEQLEQQFEAMESGIVPTEGLNISELRLEEMEDLASEPAAIETEDATESGGWDLEDLDWDSGGLNGDGLEDPTIGQVNPFRQELFPADEEEETSFFPTSLSLSESHDLSDGEEFDWQEMSGDGSLLQERSLEEGSSTFVVAANLPSNQRGLSNNKLPNPLSEQELETEQNLWESRETFVGRTLTPSDETEIKGVEDSTSANPSLYSTLNNNGDDSFTIDSRDGQKTLTDLWAGKDSPLHHRQEGLVEPTVDLKSGFITSFINSPLNQKQMLTALAAGLIPPLLFFLVSGITWLSSSLAELGKQPQTAPPAKTSKSSPDKPVPPSAKGVLPPSGPDMLWLSLLSGMGTFGVTWFLSGITKKTVKQTVQDLQEQFETLKKGNFHGRAQVYSQDELGQLATQFNELARVMASTTISAQRRASETEQAQEDLQRQVIRLLDDVEGAARGDLTVEAEVTADVLGAVADAFNSTIQNLREIVSQVKKAAEQVHKGSKDSELFARNQSKDALKMAEELAATLNSVQMMTESIKRVAENAREAEEVARSSSITALKGGEAVETTVSGILQIRETVSETARKVKRLAEASQEISKIVALISQIASRTNLLALNASIQADKAGESGRGFAIVADEVRQLADRSAKSLKEIEQIVLQIQSETGSVMTAMEEGLQQVIAVTEQSEQAKKSLEDIIQVSNRIDILVRSISADTVKQQENSRDVTQVMESVELTAQETSQESQRVAGSLQNLVGISRNLLDSVERFKIDPHA